MKQIGQTELLSVSDRSRSGKLRANLNNKLLIQFYVEHVIPYIKYLGIVTCAIFKEKV